MRNPNKVYKAPRVWKAGLPAIAITLGVLAIISIPFTLKVIVPIAVSPDMVIAAETVNHAQVSYHKAKGVYADSNTQLIKYETGNPVPFYLGVKMLATCSGGWVAQISSGLVSTSIYLSNVGGQVNAVDRVVLPYCLNPEDLGNGRKAAPVMTVSDVKVTRSLTVGYSPSVGIGLEGANLTWKANSSICSKNEKVQYQVEADPILPNRGSYNQANYVSATFTSTKKTIDIPGIVNGTSYIFYVSARCSNHYAYGATTQAKYSQPLPQPVLERVANDRYTYKISVLYTPVSSDPTTRYELDVDHNGVWKMLYGGFNILGTFKPYHYYRSSGDTYRVQASVIGGTVVSPYSDSVPFTRMN
jgi:hypothetical protein